MSETERKHKKLNGEQKVALLRRHLLEQEPVSKLCDEVGIAPTQFYRWQKEFFEKGSTVMESRPGRKKNDSHLEQRIDYLVSKLRRKDEVLSELMEEHVALKKSRGEL